MIRFAAWLVLAGPTSAFGAAPGVQNPHGSPQGCLACHAPGAAPSSPGPALPIVDTCRSCHPDADMHPVGMAPHDVQVPAAWPLENGLVTCATCHAEPAHGGPAALLPIPWHREGPYERITGLCYRCHDSASYVRSDPHHPATPRDAGDATCAACHSGVPEPGTPVEAARLRFPTEEACRTCHTGSVHAGVDEHLGKTQPSDVSSGLPTLGDGRIVCWTCHEIHSAGPAGSGAHGTAEAFRALALTEEWSAWNDPQAQWPGTAPQDHPPMLALPVDDGALCRACHGEGP